MGKLLPIMAFSILLLVPIMAHNAFAYSGPISNNAQCVAVGGLFAGSTCTITNPMPPPTILATETWDVKSGITLQVRTLIPVIGILNIESGATMIVDGVGGSGHIDIPNNPGPKQVNNNGVITVLGGSSGLVSITSGQGTVLNDCNGVMTFSGGSGPNTGTATNSGIITNKGHMVFNGGVGASSGSLSNSNVVFNQNPGGIVFNPGIGPNSGSLLGNAITPQANTCSSSEVIGGEIIPIETTSLLLAGAQSSSWMIPVLLSVLGIGLFVVSRKN